MEENQTNSGFSEVKDNEFEALKNSIKNSEVSGFSFKEESGNKAAEDTDNPTGESKSGPGTGKINVGKYIKAPWVMKVVDRVMPTVFVASFKVAGYEVDRKDFKLQKDDHEILEEPLQELLDYIVLDLKNPWNKMILALSIVYTSKTIENIEKAKKIRKRKEPKTSDGETVSMTAETTEELLDKLTQPEEPWNVGYTEDELTLIRATRKRQNKSYEYAIDWLKKKGHLKEVQL